MPVHSGCNDILVVCSSQTGRLASTPFTVAFGKNKIARPEGKNVKIYSNEVLTSVSMTLGKDGYAYFPQQVAASAAAAAAAASATDDAPSSPASPKTAAAAAKSQEDLEEEAEGAKVLTADGGAAVKSWLKSKAASVAGAIMHRVGGGGVGADVATKKQRLAPESGEEADSEPSPDDVDAENEDAEEGAVHEEQSDKNITAETIALEQRRVLSNAVENCQVVADDSLFSNVPPEAAARTPTHEQLLQLGLKPGWSKLVFACYSRIFGPVFEEAVVYVAHDDESEILVSDIDGTVSKSDKRGHLLNALDPNYWTHSGICKCYTALATAGAAPTAGSAAAAAAAAAEATGSSLPPRVPRVVCYLTARGVGMAAGTKQYVESVDQGGVKLPRGLVFMAPESMGSALKHELTKQAHLAKINALSDIRRAFAVACGSRKNPLLLALGNRMGDVRSYTSSGVPCAGQLIIDKSSSYACTAFPGVKLSVEEMTAKIPELLAKIRVPK